MSSSPIRVGVLADPYLETWQVRALRRVTERADATIPLVLVADPADQDVDPDAYASAVNDGLGIETVSLLTDVLSRERAWTLVLAERKFGELLGDDHPLEYRQRTEDVDLFESAAVRRVQPIEDGSWNELPADAVEAVADRCDVVVRFGFGLIRGDVLSAPEHGVLSFHPADIRRYRGLGPPKAFDDGRDEIGVTLQRLNDEIDGGEIVAEDVVDVSDCRTLWDVYDLVHERQIELLATGLENLRDPSVEPTRPETLGPYYPLDSVRNPGFALRTLARNLRGRLSRAADGRPVPGGRSAAGGSPSESR